MTKNKLTDIPGIGAAAADLLQKAGFETTADVAKASPEALSAVKGFGPARAARTIEAAQSLAGTLPEPQTAGGGKADANAPAEPQAPSTPKVLEGAKEKEASTPSKPAPEMKSATPAKPDSPAKPTATAKPVASAKPAVSGKPANSGKPAARPTPPRQPSVARGAAIKRLVREPWYLVGLGIALLVAAGYAQETGLLEDFGLTKNPAAASVDQQTAAAPQAPEAQQQESSAENQAIETRSAEAQAPEAPQEVAAAPVAETEQVMKPVPEPAMPGVYRPFAYGYGPASDWAQGRTDGTLSMNFRGHPGVYGYPQPYPYHAPVPYALPYPVPGPYHALPGIGSY